MKKKILGIFVCMLLIATALPAVGTFNEIKTGESNSLPAINKIDSIRVANGEILDQDLDEMGRGYTVLRIWGSYYEMGYAYAGLLADFIVQAVNSMKDFLGIDYESVRGLIDNSVWMPQENEDEIKGIVDSLIVTHPDENIDELDIKAWCCFGDWWYGYGCRGHSCWGRYVADPIKTLSTVRLDFLMIFSIFYHHVLCAYIPNDGSPSWISLGIPGMVIVVSAVNEFGTLIRQQDFNSQDPDLSPGRMSRMVASRHAATYATDPDISSHISTVFSELQKYEIMIGTFLNYYVPEGYGGVMTCDPYQAGPDFYHLRLPQDVWHHGEAMVTTNAWTDGTYTPPDEDFGVDAYYNDETPKTHESHWDILADHPPPSPVVNLHMFSVAYRDHCDMTIWADGLIDEGTEERTPRLEYEWKELFGSPDLDTHGKLSWTDVKPGATVTGNFTIENCGDNLTLLDWRVTNLPESWGDWTFSPESGTDLTPEDGDITVEVTLCVDPDLKNKNLTSAIKVENLGDPDDFCYVNATITTPKNKPFIFNFPWLNWLFERFPNMFLILSYILVLS